jgi:hypothetical protein
MDDDDDDDGDDDNDDDNNSNNVKVHFVYWGIRIKIVAHVVRMYLSHRKNLLGDRPTTQNVSSAS